MGDRLHRDPSPHHPLGAKGIGESATVGSPPAIVNAVIDALAPYRVHHDDDDRRWSPTKNKTDEVESTAFVPLRDVIGFVAVMNETIKPYLSAEGHPAVDMAHMAPSVVPLNATADRAVGQALHGCGPADLEMVVDGSPR